MFVEHDETEDEEERRIALFLAGGCLCKLLGGTLCPNQFSASMLQEAHDDCRHLTREQLIIVVGSVLCTLTVPQPNE